jgi:long-chain acyl-CoA synthetase
MMRGDSPSIAKPVHDPGLEAEIGRAVAAADVAVSQAVSIRAFRILADQFSEDARTLTPSLELQRMPIEKT